MRPVVSLRMSRIRTSFRTGKVVTSCCVLAVLSSLGTVLVSNPQATPRSRPLDYFLRTQRVTRLLGLEVQNEDGQALGTVQNFVVDLRTGRVPFVIIAEGGILGMGERRRIAPTKEVAIAMTIKDILGINVSLVRWKRAPEFDGNLARLSGEQARRIYSFYGARPASAVVPGQAAANRPSELVLVRDLLGQNIRDPKGVRLGQVSDLLLGLETRDTALLLLSRGGILRHPEIFALPLAELASPRGTAELTLNTALETFANAPEFTVQRWKSGGDANRALIVYRIGKAAAPGHPRATVDDQPLNGAPTFENQLGILAK